MSLPALTGANRAARCTLHASLQVPRFQRPVSANGQITLRWTGRGPLVLRESTDLTTWTIVPGAGPYSHTTTLIARRFYQAGP